MRTCRDLMHSESCGLFTMVCVFVKRSEYIYFLIHFVVINDCTNIACVLK